MEMTGETSSGISKVSPCPNYSSATHLLQLPSEADGLRLEEEYKFRRDGRVPFQNTPLQIFSGVDVSVDTWTGGTETILFLCPG